MYELCIFDLDGTLADTIESMAYSANAALTDLGLPAQPSEKFCYFAGDGAKELCRRCLIASGDGACTRYEEMYRLYRNYFAIHCLDQVKPYPGIPQLLEDIKNLGKKIAVLSNKPHTQAVEVVEGIFGKGYFDLIQGQTEEIPRKPDPAGARYVAAYFGVSREECLYIGDTSTDMKTGEAAGMDTVGVLWGFRDRGELEKHHADFIVETPEEICKLLVHA